jgi:hypothetical protein
MTTSSDMDISWVEVSLTAGGRTACLSLTLSC